MMDPPRTGVHDPLTSCPCCGRASRRLHRVRVRAGAAWVAACALCAGAMLERDEAAVYGGMLTRSSRRRRRAG